MDIKKEMLSLLDDFKKATGKYTNIVKEYEASDYIIENEKMKIEIASLSKKMDEFTSENKKIRDENLKLKISLNEQIMDERLSILKISQEKKEIYFKNAASGASNRLNHLEEKIKEDINKFRKKTEAELGDEKQSVLTEIQEFYNRLSKRIEAMRKKIEKDEITVVQSIKEGYRDLSSEPVDDETLQKRMKRNSLELKIGLNWINKIGIFLILIGIGYAAQYSYNQWFTDTMRSITFFILGGIFLAGGEFLYQKGKDVFSKGLLGGGISILYASVFISYFRYEIIPLNISLLLLVLITLVSLVLSVRYNSQTIAGFAIAGGYLPLITLIHDVVSHGVPFADQNLYGMLGYLFILNLLMVLISFFKRWSIIMYISFVSYISCLVYLIFDVKVFAFSIAYSIVAFVMYQLIILLYPFKYKMKLTRPDIAMLGLNTFISCIIIYLLFEKAGLKDYRGYLALVFCLMYVGLGQFVQRIMNQEKEILVLFYGTSLTFAILMIPFQFGIHWLTIGWLIEGVMLTILGYKQKIRYMELAGWCITALCITTFYLFDFFPYLYGSEKVKFFKMKYTSVIIGMITVLFIYLRALEKDMISRYSKMGKVITGYKYFVIFSFWVFLNIVGLHFYDKLVAVFRERDESLYLNNAFYRTIIVSMIHVALAFALTKIKLLQDRAVQIFSFFLYIIAILSCLFIDVFIPLLNYSYSDNTVSHYVALGILVAYNFFILFTGRELLLRVITKTKSNLEYYPLAVSVFLLGVITSFVVVQFRLGEINLLLSFIYLAMAFGSILYGFKRKYSYVRLFGLGLTFITLGKLFFWDLKFLKGNIGARIIAFFGFGICLLMISFLYQKIKNIVDVPDVKITKK